MATAYSSQNLWKAECSSYFRERLSIVVTGTTVTSGGMALWDGSLVAVESTVAECVGVVGLAVCVVLPRPSFVTCISLEGVTRVVICIFSSQPSPLCHRVLFLLLFLILFFTCTGDWQRATERKKEKKEARLIAAPQKNKQKRIPIVLANLVFIFAVS